MANDTSVSSKRTTVTTSRDHGHEYNPKRHCSVDADNLSKGGIEFESNDAMEHHCVVTADGAPQFDEHAVAEEEFLPDPDHHNVSESVQPNTATTTMAMTMTGTKEADETPADDITQSQDEMEDPDWETIARHEPAATDVPLFLAARDKRYAAEARFAAALDDAHANLKLVCDEILGVAADVYHDRREKLDAMETEIQQHFVENEERHSVMSKKLEEFAEKAQAQFQELMMRLANGKAS